MLIGQCAHAHKWKMRWRKVSLSVVHKKNIGVIELLCSQQSWCTPCCQSNWQKKVSFPPSVFVEEFGLENWSATTLELQTGETINADHASLNALLCSGAGICVGSINTWDVVTPDHLNEQLSCLMLHRNKWTKVKQHFRTLCCFSLLTLSSIWLYSARTLSWTLRTLLSEEVFLLPLFIIIIIIKGNWH